MILKDFKYGCRMLAKRPGFTLVAVLTLALGIGANTTIFTLIDTILLRPLSYDDPARIVGFWGAGSWSPGELAFLREQTLSYEHLAAFENTELTLTGRDEPLSVTAVEVSANLFSILGVEPARGRTFLAEEEQPGRGGVVVLSDRLWRRAFGADPTLIGSTITLNDQTVEVVGVMAADFKFPSRDGELWFPLEMNPASGGFRGGHYLRLIGRLAPGVTLAKAQVELTATVPLLQEEFDLREGFDKLATPATVTTFRDQIVGSSRPALLVLLAAVALVLLIACANVANLLLARAAGRQREIAVRSALGASRSSLITQLLAEGAILALAGGALGLLLATWGVDLVVSLLPEGSPRVDEIAVDPRILAFCVGVSLLTVLLFALAPAVRTSDVDLRSSLAAGGRAGAGAATRGARRTLVVAEVALAAILAIAAGLMGRSFYRLMHVDPGFAAEHTLAFRVDLPRSKYGQPEQRQGFYDQLFERLSALPGVDEVGANWRLPILQKGAYQPLEVENRPEPPGTPWLVYWRSVAGNYFATMDIPLVTGRTFSGLDGPGSLPVGLVNQTMAQKLWPGEDPLGKRIRNSMDDETWITVVGVVGDVKHNGLDQPTEWMLYRPYAQSPPWITGLSIVVKSAVEPAALIQAVREATREVDADVPVFQAQTVRQILSESVAQQSLTMVLLALFGIASLALAGLGVFGVLSFSVSQRVNEIGVRRALGARGRDVLGLVLKEGMMLALVGLALGVGGAWGVTRLMSGLLFGVSTTDGVTYLVVSGVVVGVAFIACYLPSRRASRVDPMVVLRYE